MASKTAAGKFSLFDAEQFMSALIKQTDYIRWLVGSNNRNPVIGMEQLRENCEAFEKSIPKLKNLLRSAVPLNPEFHFGYLDELALIIDRARRMSYRIDADPNYSFNNRKFVELQILEQRRVIAETLWRIRKGQEPLTDRQQEALNIIKEFGPIRGQEICDRMSNVPLLSTFTKHIVPALKKQGVQSRRGAGYYLPGS